MKFPIDYSRRAARGRAGFSLLEVLIVVVIIGILAGLLFPLTGALRKRAEKAKCISQMRSLHGSFEGYLGDYGHWPQVPGSLDGFEDYSVFWISVLTPYGGTKDIWLCPTHKRDLIAERFAFENAPEEGAGEGEGPPKVAISYIPTQFDKKPFRPYEWNQPWLAESADNHGGGGLLIMPDGAIRSTKDFFFRE
jgi:prepilin-type N-terminal cleavage/methylation domain-containing protein